MGNTLILSLLFGSGGENCDLALAVVRPGGGGGGGGGDNGTADLKSNNPHLTDGAKKK